MSPCCWACLSHPAPLSCILLHIPPSNHPKACVILRVALAGLHGSFPPATSFACAAGSNRAADSRMWKCALRAPSFPRHDVHVGNPQYLKARAALNLGPCGRCQQEFQTKTHLTHTKGSQMNTLLIITVAPKYSSLCAFCKTG